MVFQEMNDERGWVNVEYAATWKYGWDFMLDAAQIVIADLGADLQRVAVSEVAGAPGVEIVEDVKKCGGVLRECEKLRGEFGTLAVAGISGIMECPVQLTFYNQTRIVLLDCPIKQIFDEHGSHVFDNYVNSVEIKAYCTDTERRTVERLKSV